MLDFLWKIMEECIKRFREMGILKWIYCLRLEYLLGDYVLWDNLKDI